MSDGGGLSKGSEGRLAAALGGDKGSARSGRTSALLSAIGGKGGVGPLTSPTARGAAGSPLKPRMVFAIDATASRQHAWDVARSVTDSLFTAVPGGLDVALAVHGGGKLRLFTAFGPDANILRDAAAVTCSPGETRLLDILNRTLGNSGVRLVVYIGDNFEEDQVEAFRLADLMKMRGCRLVVLHDGASAAEGADAFFAALAERTGGCMLPFDANAPGKLREMLSSLAAFAAGGMDILRKLAPASASARLLLGMMKS